MDVSIAKKVVGIILSSFTEAQITSFYENGQVSQVLVGVAAKVEAAMAKPQSPVKNAADEAAHEKRDDIEAQASGRLLNRALKGVLEQPPPSQLRREDKKMDKESKKTVSNSSLSHQANVWVPKATLSLPTSEWTPQADAPTWTPVQDQHNDEQYAAMEGMGIDAPAWKPVKDELNDEDYAAMEEMGIVAPEWTPVHDELNDEDYAAMEEMGILEE